jgi:hypothetical protein
MLTNKTIRIPILSNSAFWDIDPSSLDFNQHDRFIILRVFERGSTIDKDAVIKYYGKEKIKDILTTSGQLLPLAIERAKKEFHLCDKDFACYKSRRPARNYSRY